MRVKGKGVERRRGILLKKGLLLPSPGPPSSHPPKTFALIESLMENASVFDGISLRITFE